MNFGNDLYERIKAILRQKSRRTPCFASALLQRRFAFEYFNPISQGLRV